jgi:hypothetical protein
MGRLLCAVFLAIGSAHGAFADADLALTDSGNFSSGNYLEINSSGTIVAQGGSVSGAASTCSYGLCFTGMVGSYRITGVSGAIAEDEEYMFIGPVIQSAASSPPLEILFSANVLFNSDPVQGFGMSTTGYTNGTVNYGAYYDEFNTLFGMATQIGAVGPFGPGAFSGGVGIGVSGLTYPYSVTQVISFSGGEGSRFGGTATVVADVPEPWSALLFGAALLLMGPKILSMAKKTV